MNQEDRIKKMQKELEEAKKEQKIILEKEKQVKEELQRKKEEAKKQLEKEIKEKSAAEAEKKKTKEETEKEIIPEEEPEEKQSKQKPQEQKPEEKKPEVGEIDNLQIVSDTKTKQIIVQINHSMNEEVAQQIKRLTISVQSLAIGLFVLILSIVVLAVVVFINAPAIDLWVKDLIAFAVR